jgi:hypothetical protein
MSGTGAGPKDYDLCTSENHSCSIAYNASGEVVLTPTAAPGSTFDSWTGVDCSDPKKGCVVKMDGDKTVTVTFKSGTTKQNQTITFGALGGKTYGDADFAVSATASSTLPVSFMTSGQCTIVPGNMIHILGAGSCTVTAQQAGNTSYNAAPDVPQTFAIAKATPVVAVTGGVFTYDNNEHGATASAKFSGVDVQGSFTFTYSGSASKPINAGTYNVVASFTSADTNYANATGTGTITINKANATVTVNGYTGVYDAAAHGATGSATGVGGIALNGLDLGAKFTNVPGGTASWTFTDATGNYSNANGTAAIVISKANATVTVNGYTGVYDAAAHGATGSATGVGGIALNGLDLGAKFTNAPGGTATWTFTDATGNYNSANGTVAIVISKANATITVDGYTGVYDAIAHGATGSAKGVGGIALTGLDLGASFTNVPGGTATWTFTDATGNYNNATGTAAIVIDKANATVTVNGYTGVYDAAAHGATGSAKGVGEIALSGLNVGESFTNVPGGTASWSFTDATGNYNNTSGTAAIVIGKANAIVNVQGYTGVYDAAAHGASGSATGVGGIALNGLDLGAKFTNVPGGTANWTFTDATGNYNNTSGTAAIVISKAKQTIVVSTPAPTQALYNSTFTVAAVGGLSGNPVTFAAAGVCTNQAATFTMTSGQGTCTVTLSQAGNGNYEAATAVVETVNAMAWQLRGFYQPVTSSAPGAPVWNAIKGGSTVPLKFDIFAGINGVEQTSTSAIKSMSVQTVACTGGAVLDVPADTPDTGGTSLRYDGTQFIQNWKTPKAGGCFMVTMTAADSSTITAYFQVK